MAFCCMIRTVCIYIYINVVNHLGRIGIGMDWSGRHMNGHKSSRNSTRQLSNRCSLNERVVYPRNYCKTGLGSSRCTGLCRCCRTDLLNCGQLLVGVVRQTQRGKPSPAGSSYWMLFLFAMPHLIPKKKRRCAPQ